MTELTLKQKFELYDRMNPHVYQLFRRFAFEAIEAGKTVLSASLICERIRWEVEIVTCGDQFKINNNYRAFYSRKFMQAYPGYAGIFRTRIQPSEFQNND
jgi:hypothetical protein